MERGGGILFLDFGTDNSGCCSSLSSPRLPAGDRRTFRGRGVEERDMNRRGTATLALMLGLLVSGTFLAADKPARPPKAADKQVVESKATKRASATAINFRKEFNLPFPSLGTLGTRIEAARRAPDPVALAHKIGRA